MGFVTNYNVGGEIDYVKKIKNFAQNAQPYNKMVAATLPALQGRYIIRYITPDIENVELLSLVVTCSGYGEDDYYNIYANNILWFDTWYPTEVKEGLYIGTATYVYKLEPSTELTLEFFNNSGTSKKVWLGVRMLVDGYQIVTPTYTDPTIVLTPEP